MNDLALGKSDSSALYEISIKVPIITWDDVGGLEDTKKELQELIEYPKMKPEVFVKYGMHATNGVLFYGPPGCGKTLLAEAFANQCQAKFISVNITELVTHAGELEVNIRHIFDEVRLADPCVLLLDGLDCIAKSTRGSIGDLGCDYNRIINQLLSELDGMQSKKNIFIIGATDRPDIIDPILFRPGRLEQQIYISFPDDKSRVQILKVILRKSHISKDVDLEYIAKVTKGFNGYDLAEICQHARSLANQQSMKTGKGNDEKRTQNPDVFVKLEENDSVPELKRSHFEEALKFVKPSVNEDDLHKYEMFSQKLQQQRGLYEFRFSGDGLGQGSSGGSSQGGNFEYDDDDDDLYS